MTKIVKAKITNASDGPKVLNVSPPVILQAGESIDAEMAEAELASAKASGWFDTGSAKQAEKPADAKA